MQMSVVLARRADLPCFFRCPVTHRSNRTRPAIFYFATLAAGSTTNQIHLLAEVLNQKAHSASSHWSPKKSAFPNFGKAQFLGLRKLATFCQ
jgi:hypothetical protein